MQVSQQVGIWCTFFGRSCESNFKWVYLCDFLSPREPENICWSSNDIFLGPVLFLTKKYIKVPIWAFGAYI